MEDSQVILEPIDFNKIRQKGGNHRRTQSNTAYDLCGVLNTHQSQPELIKQIAENYQILDGSNTQKLLEATRQNTDEKQIIVEDIFEIPNSSAIVPHRKGALNPINFVHRRNLSCSTNEQSSRECTQKRMNYHNLNDIIGLNVIIERKNSVESSECDNTTLEVKSERKSRCSKEERLHTRSSSVTVMDLRSSLDAVASLQDPKQAVLKDKQETPQEVNIKTQEAQSNRRQAATPCITADIQMLLQQKDTTPQKQSGSKQQQLKAPCPSQKKVPQKSSSFVQTHQTSEKTELILFPIDTWKKPANYIRDRSISKSVTPTSVRTLPENSSRGQTPSSLLNKTAITSEPGSVKALNNPFNLPKATSASSAKNFLAMLWKKKHPTADQFKGPTIAPSSTRSQERKPQKSLPGFEKPSPNNNDKTPIIFTKVQREGTPIQSDSMATLETKVANLEGKIDSLLLKNSSLEEQNNLLMKLIERLSNQHLELLKVNFQIFESDLNNVFTP